MTFIPVADWGGPATPFQLTGKQPVGRKPDEDRIWDYAGEHLGFYGWLRVANNRISKRTGVGLMDLADRRWRDAYDEQAHPAEEADEAIGEESAEMGFGP